MGLIFIQKMTSIVKIAKIARFAFFFSFLIFPIFSYHLICIVQSQFSGLSEKGCH